MDRLNPDDDSTYLDNRLMPRSRQSAYAYNLPTDPKIPPASAGVDDPCLRSGFERLSAEHSGGASHTTVRPN
jgi:hypothetical protein